MSTVTVKTKEELERAVKDNEEKIIISGDLANKIIKKLQKKAVAKKLGIGSAILAGAAAIVGIVAAPVTGGASAVAGVSCLVATTAGGATVTITTAEVIAGIFGILGALGITASVINTIAKHYDVKISNGSTTVECVRK